MRLFKRNTKLVIASRQVRAPMGRYTPTRGRTLQRSAPAAPSRVYRDREIDPRRPIGSPMGRFPGRPRRDSGGAGQPALAARRAWKRNLSFRQ